MPKVFYLSTSLAAILCIILGVIVIANPSGTMASFAVLISAAMIIAGIFNIYYAVLVTRFKGKKAVYFLAEGIISALLGILLLSNTEALKNLIPLMVGFWIALKGTTSIISAIDMKKYNHPRWNIFLTAGICAVLIAVLIAAFPAIISVYLSLILGLFLILIGILLILFLFYNIKLRNL